MTFQPLPAYDTIFPKTKKARRAEFLKLCGMCGRVDMPLARHVYPTGHYLLIISMASSIVTESTSSSQTSSL